MKNIIKERWAKGAICHKCQSPDYREEPPYFQNGKPNYCCNSCGTTWQYGYDGGKYAKYKNKTWFFYKNNIIIKISGNKVIPIQFLWWTWAAVGRNMVKAGCHIHPA